MAHQADDRGATLAHRLRDGLELGLLLEQTQERFRLFSDLAEEQFSRTVRSSCGGHQRSSRSPLTGSKR